MSKKTICCAGIVVILFTAAVSGCKKKDAALQGQKAPGQGKPPVHEQIPTVKFSSIAPTNLPMVPAMPGGVGGVEWINDVAAVDKNKVSKKNKVTLIGWVANEKDVKIPSTVIVQLNSTAGMVSYYAQAARTKLKRPDIAKEMKNPIFENCSFQLDADLSDVPPGTYMIGFLMSDGKYIIGFDTPRYLVIE